MPLHNPEVSCLEMSCWGLPLLLIHSHRLLCCTPCADRPKLVSLMVLGLQISLVLSYSCLKPIQLYPIYTQPLGLGFVLFSFSFFKFTFTITYNRVYLVRGIFYLFYPCLSLILFFLFILCFREKNSFLEYRRDVLLTTVCAIGSMPAEVGVLSLVVFYKFQKL